MENIITHFWNRNKIIFKSLWIGLLILILLIPTVLISNLINERQERQQQAVGEISAHWAAAQTLTGPVIGVPYFETVSDNQRGARQEKRWAWFLPDKLDINARIVPETRYRGIFRAVVYTTELKVNCRFDSLHLADLGLPAGNMSWNEAAVFFDVADLRGLQEEVSLRVNSGAGQTDIELAPAGTATEQFKNSLSGTLPGMAAAAGGALSLSTTIRLKGTASLSFVPAGKETKVKVSSDWRDPSFSGSSLPDVRTVGDSGFVADWRVLAMTRSFPQQWKGAVFDMGQAAFGVGLILPVDSYQQTTRCVKYAILIIVLTFTAFFLIEWVYQRAIHSLQYLLVGFALCLFYTLLISFSEYIGFNPAYGVAAAATIGLITWYVGSMLRSRAMSLFIFFLLAVQYGFVFTLIQLQDYALLLGSVGLFITLGLVMYFSRKIKWATV